MCDCKIKPPSTMVDNTVESGATSELKGYLSDNHLHGHKLMGMVNNYKSFYNTSSQIQIISPGK